MKRILYHHRTQAEDGQAVHIRSLIEAFRAEGCVVQESALVQRDGSAERTGQEPGRAGRFSWLGGVPRFVRELGEHAYSVPAASRLVRDARSFEPDFIYERYAFGNRGGVRAARRVKLPLVLEVNSPMVLELGRTRGLSFPRLASAVEKSIFLSADRICVVTSVLGEMLCEMGIPAERLLVTPNGVHPELYSRPDREAARQDLGIQGTEGPVLGFVGYYRDWHRLDLVVEGLASDELAGAHLVLVGEGPAEQGLRELAEGRGVADRVHFAGTRPHAGIPGVLPGFDVALVPAINPYASPLKLHEYMAAGLAVVAPDQPNLREVLTPGENALLVEPGDGDALLGALARLLGDADLRDSLGQRARKSIEEQGLTWRDNARRILEVMEEGA